MRPFLVAVALSMLASTTQAMETRIDFAPKGAVKAGELVTVRWSGLPADVDELEFLLQRDGGDVVRLTEQLRPSSGSFALIVPDLPSRHAVLLLRAGIHGEEITLASSAPFVIAGAESRARLEFRHGEWWTVEFRKHSAAPPRISLVPQVQAPEVFESPRRPLFLSTRLELGEPQPPERLQRTAVAANTRCGAPFTIPQRK